MDRNQICNFLKELTSPEYWYKGFNIVDVFVSELYVEVLNSSSRKSFLDVLKDAGYYVSGFIGSYFKIRARNIPTKSQTVFVITERNQFDQVKLLFGMMSKQMPCLFVTNKLSLSAEAISLTESKNIVVLNAFHNPIWKSFKSFTEWAWSPFSDPTDGIDSKIEKHIRQGINQFKSRLDRYLSLIESIDKANSVKAIIVGNDISFEGRIFASYFGKKNIPTFSIQHGNCSGNPLINFMLVDYFFVFGKKVKETLYDEYQLRKTQVIVSGAPYLENMEFEENSTLKRHAPYILVAFSGPGNNTSLEHHMLLIDAVRKWSFETASTIIIKLHPKDNLAFYSGFGSNVVFFKKEEANEISTNIFEWIKYSKFIITGASNIANESILVKVPVLTLDLKNEYHGFEFIHTGATIHARELAEFFVAASRLDADPLSYPDMMANARSYIDSYYARVDSPSQFICNYISSLISSPSCVA